MSSPVNAMTIISQARDMFYSRYSVAPGSPEEKKLIDAMFLWCGRYMGAMLEVCYVAGLTQLREWEQDIPADVQEEMDRQAFALDLFCVLYRKQFGEPTDG